MAVGAELLARRQAAVVRGVSNATQRQGGRECLVRRSQESYQVQCRHHQGGDWASSRCSSPSGVACASYDGRLSNKYTGLGAGRGYCSLPGAMITGRRGAADEETA